MVTRVTMQSSRGFSRMLFEELLTVLRLAESFCASGPRGGKCACQVAGREACRQIGAPQKLMEEARIKAISRSHRVHGFYRYSGAHEALFSALCQRALATEFHHDQRHQRSEFLHGRFEIANS